MSELTYKQIEQANACLKPSPIKGKDYIEVNQRIKAFRMLHPNGCIQTEILSLEGGVCTMKVTVIDPCGRVLGTGHAQEKEGSTFINKTSYIENCETSAVGRALGMCGIGIDAAVASYEEVANAKMQQDDKPSKPAEAEEYAKPITASQVDTLKKMLADKEIDEGYVLDGYKLKDFSEMMTGTYMQFIRNLNHVKECYDRWRQEQGSQESQETT
jgi:hypothetical protein